MNKKQATTNVLLVDDDEIILNSLSAGLEASGYRVTASDSANKAIDIFRGNPPDIVVIDYNMPEMLGTECAATMLKEKHCPIIMLSAINDLHVVREAIGLGISTYIVKPVSPDKLIPCIEAALARFAEIEAMIQQGDNIQEMMEKNRIINAAVGIVMERLQLPFDEAFERLRRLAREQRQSFRDIAFEIVDSVTSVNTLMDKLKS